MKKILSTEASLMNYAAWYAMRYMPSRRKLQEALLKKSGGSEILTSTVAQKMNEYISEERTVDGLVKMYLDQWKTLSYVKNKLREKLFDPHVIAQVFEEYHFSFESWDTYRDIAEKKIQDLISKNKSRRYIEWTLLQKYSHFKAEISELLDAYCSDESDAITSEFEKLRGKHDRGNPKERQKIIQKLSMKGFSYDDIKRALWWYQEGIMKITIICHSGIFQKKCILKRKTFREKCPESSAYKRASRREK